MDKRIIGGSLFFLLVLGIILVLVGQEPKVYSSINTKTGDPLTMEKERNGLTVSGGAVLALFSVLIFFLIADKFKLLEKDTIKPLLVIDLFLIIGASMVSIAKNPILYRSDGVVFENPEGKGLLIAGGLILGAAGFTWLGLTIRWGARRYGV